MAKTLTGVTRRAQLEWTTSAEGDVSLRFLSYEGVKDDSLAVTHDPTGTQPTLAGPRDLTAAELGDGTAGTVKKLLDDLDASIKTAEGIA